MRVGRESNSVISVAIRFHTGGCLSPLNYNDVLSVYLDSG